MPGGHDDAREIFRFLASDISEDTYVNIMEQYYPAGGVDVAKQPELSRRPYEGEILAARGIAKAEGLWRFDERWRSSSSLGPVVGRP
jgi:putative pyruvate formate lyase activating enzyme